MFRKSVNHLCRNVAQHVLEDIKTAPTTASVASPNVSPSEANAATNEPVFTPMQTAETWNMSSNIPITSADVPNPEFLPESAPGETARIHAALSHPYFSNHPTQTSASGVGDIVINNRPAKRARKTSGSRGKIIGIVIALLVIIIVGVVVASSIVPAISKPNQAAVSKSFLEFSTVLKTGPGNSDVGEKWFIDNLTDDALNVSQTNDAVNQLYELYNNFVTKFNDSELTNNSNLRQDVSNENVLLTLIGTYSNLQSVVNNLTEEFLKNSDQANIEGLVKRTLPTQTYNEKQANFQEGLSKYLTTKLQMAEFYKDSYCYYDGTLLDGDCVALLDIDKTYTYLIKVNELAALYLRQDKSGILDELHSQTNKLQEALK